MKEMPDNDGFGSLDISEDLRELIKPELAPGERLLWAGRSGFPLAKVGSRGAWIGLGCGLLLSAGLCVGLYVRSVLTVPNLIEFMNLALLFLGFLSVLFLIGSILTFQTQYQAARSKEQTYALTDRRVIRWSPGKHAGLIEVRSIPFTTIKVDSLLRTQNPEGVGNLMLRGSYDQDASLQSIPHVQRVERLLREHLPKSAWKPEPIHDEDVDDLDDLTY